MGRPRSAAVGVLLDVGVEGSLAGVLAGVHIGDLAGGVDIDGGRESFQAAADDVVKLARADLVAGVADGVLFEEGAGVARGVVGVGADKRDVLSVGCARGGEQLELLGAGLTPGRPGVEDDRVAVQRLDAGAERRLGAQQEAGLIM
jgi:hypothetical protein